MLTKAWRGRKGINEENIWHCFECQDKLEQARVRWREENLFHILYMFVYMKGMIVTFLCP